MFLALKVRQENTGKMPATVCAKDASGQAGQGHQRKKKEMIKMQITALSG